MPNRIIREGILTSPKVARLGWPEEVFYRRLLSVVDDFGRYYANPGMLRAACYPRQLNKVSDPDIEKWLRACVDAALVRVYPAEDGESYLQVLKFDQQVRAKKSRFPEPLSTCVADAAQERSERAADAPVFVGVSVSESVGEPARKRAPSRKVAMPAEFGVSERVRTWASEKGFDRLEEHLDAFRRKCQAKGYTYADWDAALMEAIREDWAKLRGRLASGAAPPPEHAATDWRESRAGVEGMGEKLGIGRWDQESWERSQGECDWPTYKAKVFRAAGVELRAA